MTAAQHPGAPQRYLMAAKPTGIHGASARTRAIRSGAAAFDDKGLHWEHWSTIAFDPLAGIISHDEPALHCSDGTLICMMRTGVPGQGAPGKTCGSLTRRMKVNPGAARSGPNIWGYSRPTWSLKDGRMLAAYGYRRAPGDCADAFPTTAFTGT